jgi:hypothetical protein
MPMNNVERAVARLLAFAAIHGVECEAAYGGESVTHCFSSFSTTETITVHCVHCHISIAESVPMRVLNDVVTFKDIVAVRPIRERIDDRLDDYCSAYLVLTAAEVPLNIRRRFQRTRGLQSSYRREAVRPDTRARRH